jgi:hypothetical protein
MGAVALLVPTPAPAAGSTAAAAAAAALDARVAAALQGAADTLQSGMTQCMISEPVADSPACITEILGSEQAIAALAWNPGSVQLGAAVPSSLAELDERSRRRARENGFVFGGIQKGLGAASRGIQKGLFKINPIRAYSSYNIRKRRKEEQAHREKITERVNAGINATNMTEREEWTTKSWEEGVQDKTRCGACCNGVENNAVPFFEREESRANIDLPGTRFDRRFTTVQIRSCHRNKLCSQSYGLNPKFSSWFPPKFNPLILKMKRCQGSEYRYYARKRQCEVFCSEKNGMSAASHKRVAMQRREDLAKKIQYTCYRNLDPFLPGMFRVGGDGSAASVITLTRQRLTISAKHDVVGHDNQIKLFRLGEVVAKNNDNIENRVANEDAENDESAVEPTANFPLHFTGTLELWGADMGKIVRV